MTTKERNAQKLYGLVSRIDSKEKCNIAEAFVDKCLDEGKIDTETWDDLREAIAYTYREINREERRAYTKPFAM